MWKTFGAARAPELQWVLVFAWWRSAGDCPYVVAQLRNNWWEAPDVGGKMAAKPDDRWCAISGGVR